MTDLALKREPTATEVERYVLRSFENSEHSSVPYNYWLLQDVLPTKVLNDIVHLPFDTPQNLSFYGKREINNASRIYFTHENQKRYAVCNDVVDCFESPAVLTAIRNLTKRDVSQGRLRIEYCQDTDGFWLEPHVDISVKLFTMLVYLSDDPDLADAGTDIYDSTPEHNIVATADYACNKGLIFIPAHNTWHGFTKRPIKGLRKSLIINYVSNDWKDQWELA
jgi:hypothetical protein